MKHNFQIDPPESASVSVFDRGRDVSGNPTARYLLMWSNGKSGESYAGGRCASARREQVGYRDKTSAAALARLAELFPWTAWKVSPDGIEESFGGDCARFQAIRDYENEPVPVIFRADKGGDFAGEVTAVFPTIPAGRDYVQSYARVGQHGAASRGWYDTTRGATREESESLLRELYSLGYFPRVKKRWTRDFDEMRAAKIRRDMGGF